MDNYISKYKTCCNIAEHSEEDQTFICLQKEIEKYPEGSDERQKICEAWEKGDKRPTIPIQRSINAIRLTIFHSIIQDDRTKNQSWTNPGAAFLVKIEDNWNDCAFEDWCKKVVSTRAIISPSPLPTIKNQTRRGSREHIENIKIETKTQTGDILALDTQRTPRNNYKTIILPLPSKNVENRDILNGRPQAPLVKAYKKSPATITPSVFPHYWDVTNSDTTKIWPPMEIGDEPGITGRKFIWLPLQAGKNGSGSFVGSATWLLDLPDKTTYYLWGRVLTPTTRQNAFHVRITDHQHDPDAKTPIQLSPWTPNIYKRWTWVPIDLSDFGTCISASPIHLASGQNKIQIQLFALDAGTKIDRLFIAQNPDDIPDDQRDIP